MSKELDIPGARGVKQQLSGRVVTRRSLRHRLSKPLRNDLAGLRSARRGDYRILLRVDDDHRTILIVDINHRAHIYRP